eukprot:TRINITY_DN27609_c0_g1_i1.p1 TRINITY_DN27609_c0_g1~~TRINITY_DN27609_c0_g1_i1.p1  ORF type:complete len:103 (+),score=23.10 TRINITY_DN27609_c0_g1_i1:47-310(+)
MASSSIDEAVEALKYLQNQVYEMVKHDNPKEVEEFCALTTHLFVPKVKFGAECGAETYKERMAVFEQICELFPKSMRQPTANLMDFV